jgi:hypothetical protein
MINPELEPVQVPEFTPIDHTPSEADSIRRQDADELWYRSPFHYNGRP